MRRVLVVERAGGFAFGWFAFVVLAEVIFEFFGLGLVGVVVDAEFEFSFFGAQNDRLAFHAPDHVERGARRAAQRIEGVWNPPADK